MTLSIPASLVPIISWDLLNPMCRFMSYVNYILTLSRHNNIVGKSSTSEPQLEPHCRFLAV